MKYDKKLVKAPEKPTSVAMGDIFRKRQSSPRYSGGLWKAGTSVPDLPGYIYVLDAENDDGLRGFIRPETLLDDSLFQFVRNEAYQVLNGLIVSNAEKDLIEEAYTIQGSCGCDGATDDGCPNCTKEKTISFLRELRALVDKYR